jgi:hypothetical protein
VSLPTRMRQRSALTPSRMILAASVANVGEAEVCRHQNHRQGHDPSRACRPLNLRYPLLYLFGPARHRTHRHGGQRTFGRRKHALAARCRVQRRSVAIPNGSVCKKNMAAVGRFALDLVRVNRHNGSVKSRRQQAGWNPQFLVRTLQLAWSLTWIACRVSRPPDSPLAKPL